MSVEFSEAQKAKITEMIKARLLRVDERWEKIEKQLSIAFDDCKKQMLQRVRDGADVGAAQAEYLRNVADCYARIVPQSNKPNRTELDGQSQSTGLSELGYQNMRSQHFDEDEGTK